MPRRRDDYVWVPVILGIPKRRGSWGWALFLGLLILGGAIAFQGGAENIAYGVGIVVVTITLPLLWIYRRWLWFKLRRGRR